MRATLVLVLALASAATQAATVTFDDMAPLADCGGLPCISVATSQGFVFAIPDDPVLQDNAALGVYANGPSGNFLSGDAAYEYGTPIIVTHASGQAFSLHSVDIEFTNYDGTGPSVADPLEILGYDATGGLIAQLTINPDSMVGRQWINLSFDADWNSVHKVAFGTQVVNSLFGWDQRTVALDNFAATVVPVPAAIWLFGSALVGLLVRGRASAS